MRWQFQHEVLQDGQVEKYTLTLDGDRLRCCDVIDLWCNSAAFRMVYIAVLQESQHKSYFWEHPPIARNTLTQPYEFVLVRSDRLHKVAATPHFFESYYESDGKIVQFDNLGKDAVLIVPSPLDGDHYADIARFVRHGEMEQVSTFFQSIGAYLHKNMPVHKLWLNTSGLGVYYLHARLDQRPKYYVYRPYADL